MRKRSISSASPPAVGNTMTGWPNEPQRHSVTSRSSRSLRQRVTTLSPRPISALPLFFFAPPGLDALPEQFGELLNLVGGEQRRHLGAHRVAGDLATEELPRHLVEVSQMHRAELLEPLGLEPLGRHL